MLRLNILKAPVDQSWDVYRIATEATPSTWEDVFKDAKDELIEISRWLDDRYFYPNKEDLFASFNHTPLSKVKVVILGQDPYHQTISLNGKSMPRAMGLSFSVRLGDEVPSSLKNIYTELKATVKNFTIPDHGDLRDWARQGILLLNSCLTVQPGVAGSHGSIWLGFITKVFKAISLVNPQCIYVLWGRSAQALRPMLGEKSIVFEAAHPSGLSAKKGFFGCNHFNLINEALIRQGKESINWHLRPSVIIRNPTTIETPTPTGPERKLVPVNMTMSYPAIPTILQGSPATPVPQKYPTILGQPTILETTTKSNNSNNSPILLSHIANTKKVEPNIIVELKNGIITSSNPTVNNKTVPSPKQVPIIPNINFKTTESLNLPVIQPLL